MQLIKIGNTSVSRFCIGSNKPIEEAFQTFGRTMRKNDVSCIGIYPKNGPDMLRNDIQLFDCYSNT